MFHFDCWTSCGTAGDFWHGVMVRAESIVEKCLLRTITLIAMSLKHPRNRT